MGKQLCRYVKDYVLYDLETTGMSCYYDEVIEISALKVRGGRIVEEFSRLVNPGRPIPYAASSVNNIFDDMVENEPPFNVVLPQFLDFIGDDILVGHNIASFDMKFICRDCEKYLHKQLENDYIDTLKLAKIVFPNWKHRRLSDLAEYYGIPTSGAHRALADCKMNQQIFENLGKELAEKSTQRSNSEIKVCKLCGLPLKKRNGMYGEFFGCSGFPICRYTEKI